MSIGKNAIKRVENNGYSNVTSSAPDMENSVVSETPAEKPVKTVKRTPAKKTAGGKNGFERYEFGSALPYWLL